jgi:hypothetical protein
MDRVGQVRARFVRLLQLAYSGELGAALAYRGHAASVADADERVRIKAIRLEELDHRTRVGSMLTALGARPDAVLEVRNRCIGTAIALFCRVGGWFLPMYGAGWLERRNIVEYERAARLGLVCGATEHVDDLLEMAEVEWEHERYFREKAAGHPFARLLRVWRGPGAKEDIRRSFMRFVDARKMVLVSRSSAARLGEHDLELLAEAAGPRLAFDVGSIGGTAGLDGHDVVVVAAH